MTAPIQKVVVLGASSAGLLAAVTLKRFFPQLEVLLLYTEKYAPIGVGESTTAWVPQFLHDHLQISRAEFFQAVCPVWKLGIRFEWGDPARSHFNYTFDRQFAYDVKGLSRSPGYYCMHDMAQASRFSILMDKGHAPLWRDLQGQIQAVIDGFGYHIDIDEFLNFLWQKAQALGVATQMIEVLGAERDDQGNVRHLQCANGVRIAADLFIDASGFQSKLLGGVLAEPFVPFSDRLFCDTAVISTETRATPILPYTTVTTMNAGWRWRIDLKDRISYGYVFSSQFCDRDQAVQEFLAATPGAHDQVKFIPFKSGRYQNFWVNNVIAIGNAAGFVEPLESTGQHMIAETLWQVVLTLMDSHLTPNPTVTSTVNTYIAHLWQEIRDFLALHFKFNRQRQTPFWQHCQAETLLGQAQTLVDLYQTTGVCRAMAHVVPSSSLFEVDGYLTLLCGQNLPIADLPALTVSQQKEWQQYRQVLYQEVKQSLMPQQAIEFLKDIYTPSSR